MRDVATAAGVSAATVSRVLNNSAGVDSMLAERVMRAISDLNYRPNLVARGLRTQATRVIALIISDIENPFFTSVCRGVEDVASQSGYSVMLCNADEDLGKEREYIGVVAAQHAAGVIISPASVDDTDTAPLAERGIAVVALDRRLKNDGDAVLVDNRAGARSATHHLLASGARRVACITGLPSTTTARERLAGYLDALQVAGLQADTDLQQFTDFKESGGYEATIRLLDLADPPDALFVANNRMTVGALRALHEHGARVPDDVSVVGFDDVPWAEVVKPTITTVRQPTYEIGMTAARLLLRRLEATGAESQEVVLEPELVVRESSVKPRARRSPARSHK